MDLDAAVVADEAELAEAVHEEADAGPGGADHFSQGFLRDGRNECLWFSRFAKLGHEEEYSRQTLFTGVEELIDEIGLGSHAAGEQELEKEVCEGRLVVHLANHLSPVDFERDAGVDGGGGEHAQPNDRGEALLTDEVAGGQERDGCFLAVVGDDSELCPAALEIEDGVCPVALGKEGLRWFQIDDSSTEARVRKKGGRVGCGEVLDHG